MSNADEPTWHKGACHCGAVTFEVRAPKDIEIADCNCSICHMTGFQHLEVDAGDFRILQGKDNLCDYRFNEGVARHLFCKTCGIKAFYVPRSKPDGYSVNLRCLDREAFRKVTVFQFDGQNWEEAYELGRLEQ